MTLNKLSIEGKVHTKPEARNTEKVEFVLRHEARWGGGVHFFPVEAWSYELVRSRIREGSEVIVLGSLGERQWMDPRTAEVRLSVILCAEDIREVTPTRAMDRVEGSDESSF
jgi:single-stranded DNA-binding protein